MAKRKNSSGAAYQEPKRHIRATGGSGKTAKWVWVLTDPITYKILAKGTVTGARGNAADAMDAARFQLLSKK
jgi:hypothetical protein